MIRVKRKKEIGTKLIQLVKWKLGYYKCYMVRIFTTNGKRVYYRDFTYLKNAKEHFKEKVKELEEYYYDS